MALSTSLGTDRLHVPIGDATPGRQPQARQEYAGCHGIRVKQADNAGAARGPWLQAGNVGLCPARLRGLSVRLARGLFTIDVRIRIGRRTRRGRFPRARYCVRQALSSTKLHLFGYVVDRIGDELVVAAGCRRTQRIVPGVVDAEAGIAVEVVCPVVTDVEPAA